jgi:DnaJ-class molecular chaperone
LAQGQRRDNGAHHARADEHARAGATLIKSITMTDDINRQNELKKMELCDACAGIQRNWRKAPGHAELVQGANRQERRGGSLVTVTQYSCDRCGTAWEYENDKANQKAGWSVVGRLR